MAYELKLQADTLVGLARMVSEKDIELKMLVGTHQAVAKEVIGQIVDQNFAAARSEPLVSKEEMEALHSVEDVTGKVDADGLPWDERIHSSNKKMTAKGVWVRRRGLTDLQFDEIAAQLKGGEPVSPYIPPAIPAPQPAASEQWAHLGNPVPPPPAPMGQYIPPHVPQTISSPVHVPPAVQPAQYQIGDVLNKVTQIYGADPAGATAYINSITHRLSVQFQVQVQSLTDITNQPQMIAFVMQMFASDGK